MLRPLKDRVLLKVQKQSEEVYGIIVNKKDTTEQGQVLAVGSKVVNVTLGDTVLITTGAGLEVSEGRLISDSEILAIL